MLVIESSIPFPGEPLDLLPNAIREPIHWGPSSVAMEDTLYALLTDRLSYSSQLADRHF